jgi:hypothetical protein
LSNREYAYQELVNLIQGSYQVQNVQIGVNLKILIYTIGK